jgi:hypothetical protein
VQELPGVVPLVERGLDVDPLVALQAYELGVEDPGEDLATSVLPTPASPSMRRGLRISTERWSAVAMDASAT